MQYQKKSEIYELGFGARALVQHPLGSRPSPIVVCLPGDSRSGWTSKTWTTLSQKFASAGMASAVLEYPRMEAFGADICPLHLAADAWDQMWELLTDLGFPAVRSVVASSFGAAVLLERPNQFTNFQFVCLKSPAVDLLPSYLHDLGMEKMREWANTSKSCPLGEAFTTILKTKGYLSASLLEAPTLVLHGSEDSVVPISQAELLGAVLPNVEFQKLDGANHQLSDLKHWKTAIEAIVSSITSSVST